MRLTKHALHHQRVVSVFDQEGGEPMPQVVKPASKRSKRTISAAGRKRIAAAQRARWAKVRAAKKAA
jgi:hypothetical protein